MKIHAVLMFHILLGSQVLAEPPREWIEPATGHRVVRLSREAGSTSFYFHQNAYTPEGYKLLISTPSGLATVNLTNREIEVVLPRGSFNIGGSSGVEVGRKSRQVYYATRGETGTVIRATHLDTRITRELVKLPFLAALNGVNADETLAVGTMTEATAGNGASGDDGPRRRLGLRATDRRAMKFYSADLRTGEVKFFNRSTNWLNHAQCSPTDPTMMLY